MSSFIANKRNKRKRNVQMCFGRKRAEKNNVLEIIKLMAGSEHER